MTERTAQEPCIEGRELTTNAVVVNGTAESGPQGELPAETAEWEHMERIRRETAKPVPYIPDDRL